MILYTNGTGHTAGAHAVNQYGQANEDPSYWQLENRPHPDNIKVAWGTLLSEWLKMAHHTDARADNTNVNIIEQAQSYLYDKEPEDVFIILQWGQIETLERDYGYIKAFYEYLQQHGYQNFLFFNGDAAWQDIEESDRFDFDKRFMSPYNQDETYSIWLSNQGYGTVITSNEFFSASAQSAWARHLLKYIADNKMI